MSGTGKISTPDRSEVESLLGQIHNVFRKVERGGGVTLHETRVIDMYGSEFERQVARRMDTDSDWMEVRDKWIEEITGVGGLSFLDESGFRYYLPAYMSYFLRMREEPDCLTFYLREESWDFARLFTSDQLEVIAKFVEYATQRSSVHCLSREVFQDYWCRYFHTPKS